MSNVQHKTLGGNTGDSNLHAPGYWGSTDPGAVGAGRYWIDTAQGFPYYVLKVRNQNNNGWDTIVANVVSDGQVNITTAAQIFSHIINDARDAGPKVWHHKLDDASTAIDRVWSASKINTHTTNALIHRSINDSGTSETELWSAAKIIAQLATKQNNVSAGQLIPVGAIVDFGGETIPAGFLHCNGAAVSRTTYSALFSYLGTAWGYGNGTTTFNVPDIIGRFRRMKNFGWGRDPDAASRVACNTGGASGDAVGSYQADKLKDHRHRQSAHGWNRWSEPRALWAADDDWTYQEETIYSYYVDGGLGGNETRPMNVYVNVGIKF